MKKLPEDINKRLRTPMYLQGITLNDTRNVAARTRKRGKEYDIWYFDEDQIYRKTTYSDYIKGNLKLKGLLIRSWKDCDIFFCEISHTDTIFTPNRCERNLILDRSIISRMKEGEHAERLLELADTVYLKEPNKVDYTEFDRKFQKIEKPIFLGTQKSFDYIKIYINCSLDITKQDVISHKKALDKWALDHLQTHRSFQKYDIPITALALSNLILTRDKRLEYTFEIKKELRQLLEQE